MHILIIPSEFFDEEHKPLAGIFQKDQANVLFNNGNTVGVLAIKPKFTFHELIYLTLKKKAGYLTQFSKLNAWKLWIRSNFLSFKQSIISYEKSNLQIVKYNGCYSFVVKNNFQKRKNWIKIGREAFEIYVNTYGKPDVIHAHNILFGGILGIELSKRYQIPMVLTEHSSSHQMGSKNESDRRLIQEEIQQISVLNAVSPALGRLLETKYLLPKGRVEWLPNVMDKSFENIPVNKKNSVSQLIRLFNVASLIPLKQHSNLIAAFALAFKYNENIHLEIAGSGLLAEHLQSQIYNLKMENRIKLLGSLSRLEIVKKMSEVDFLVHSSEYETFGVVLIEALSLGRPVLSTACGGPECIVNEKNGILVPPNEVNALADGMKEMVKNLAYYKPEKIKQDLIQRFGQAAFYRRVMDIYKKAIYDYNY